jgi:uncharacterized protein (TIRG00374 family)
MNRKRWQTAAKLLVSCALLFGVYWKLISTAGAEALWQRLANLAWGWLVFGFCVQFVAVACSVLRWQRLLLGQGLRVPLRHLIGSFMIGRFFGELAPGGWTGLNGYRIYDIARHSGKLARATASIGVEMVLGWLSFGAVVLFGSIYGARFVGVAGVCVIDAFFVALIATAVSLTSRPRLFRTLAKRLPEKLEQKLRTTTDALCAYEGRSDLLVQAALLGVGTHVFRAFIYVASSHALHADLSVGEVFFGSSLQVFATFLPASFNGVGLREATAVAVYTRGGIPEATAVLIPTLGFLLELALSSLGGVWFLLRKSDYRADITVTDPAPVTTKARKLPATPPWLWPRPVGRAVLGAQSGVLAGAALGGGEALLIMHESAAAPDPSVLAYGTLSYALLLAALGAGIGWLRAWLGQKLQRAALPDAQAFAQISAGLFAVVALAITAFRLRRDYFHEELRWLSPNGALVLAGCAVLALLCYAVGARVLQLAIAHPRGEWLLRPWTAPALVLAWVVLLSAAPLLHTKPERATSTSTTTSGSTGVGNLLLVVVDTLRADHLPSYGYARGKTPALDRFAEDALRFDAAYANASWTRPSFASLLSGRFAASHRTIGKSDALPDEVITLPEALRAAGYQTFGVVTNFNIAPYFNFHQGFDSYTYLEPTFALGANDAGAKLLLIEGLRHQLEMSRARSNTVAVGSAYQDAACVTGAVLRQLDHRGPKLFFMLAAYMDPHDPYYPHPYDGTAYSRAAHPRPKADETQHLVHLYDGEITFWDEHFGSLVRELKARGLYDGLTIVVTSDHGEEFYDHGGFWHGSTLYDEALHVPLFVKLPEQRLAGTVVRHMVQSIDVMPTLLELARVSVPPAVQGHNLLRGHDRVLAEESHEGNVESALRMSRTGSEVKLIRANVSNPRGVAPRELYQVDRDPHEQVNMVDEEPDLARTVDEELERALREAAEGRAAQSRVDVATDITAVERLRALGYTSSDGARPLSAP